MTRAACDLLVVVARCRALLAVRGGIGSSYLVRGGSQPLCLASDDGSVPIWTPVAAFPAALRCHGSGRIVSQPRCGLCGCPPAGSLAAWATHWIEGGGMELDNG